MQADQRPELVIGTPHFLAHLAERVFEDQPGPAARALRGAVAYRMGDLAAAVGDLEAALDGAPLEDALAPAACVLAMGHWRLGERELALRWLERADGVAGASGASGASEEWEARLALEVLRAEAAALCAPRGPR